MMTIEYGDAVRLIGEAEQIPGSERLLIRDSRLHELVEYARQHSPYFRELYGDLPEKYALEDLPPTEKRTLQARYNDWLTDRDLNKERVNEYLERAVTDTSLLAGKYTALKTSGSTGEPLLMVRDDYHNKIHGVLVSRRLLRGLDPNLLNPSLYRIATVIHTSPVASSYNSYLRTLAAFPDYAGNMLAISVLDDVESIVKRLNEFKPDVLTGYASSLIALAKEKKEGRLDIDLKLIANSAELLPDESYRALTEAFGCPVINNYCMTEGGEIAMANGSPEMRLNEDWVIVEPVDENLQPVRDPSEFSDGILVTDLSNFVQPIIRYHVDDRVRIIPPENDSALPKLEIDGRSFKTFSLAGKRYTSAILVMKTETWPGLMKSQGVKVADDTIEMRGICFPGENPVKVLGSLSESLQAYFHKNGCPEAKVTYSLEPMIHNSKGGKIPEFIDISND